MRPWYVNVGFTATKSFDEDTPFDISDELADIAAVMSVSRAFDAGRVAVTLDADTPADAFTTAMQRVADALTSNGIAHDITSVQAQTEEEFTAELAEPIYPEVVGYAEIARMANVSRQRARQFAEIAAFPHPVIETAQGPLFNVHAVERWLETRPTRRTPATV